LPHPGSRQFGLLGCAPRISVLGKPADPLQAAASDPNRLGIRGGCREHPVSGAISSDRQHSSRTCRRTRATSWHSAARYLTRPSIPHLNAARNGGLLLPISDSFCPEDEVPADLGHLSSGTASDASDRSVCDKFRRRHPVRVTLPVVSPRDRDPSQCPPRSN
jgi:hypothetical protein